MRAGPGSFALEKTQERKEIAKDVAKLTQVRIERDPYDFLTQGAFLDKNVIDKILRRLARIEVYLGMRPLEGEDKVFDFHSEEFDGLSALRRMNREADDAISRTSVVLEDTRLFLESRKVVPVKPAP